LRYARLRCMKKAGIERRKAINMMIELTMLAELEVSRSSPIPLCMSVSERFLTCKWTVVQQQVRGDVIHIGVVLDVHTGIQWDEQMEACA
jgi:hypothetical protein